MIIDIQPRQIHGQVRVPPSKSASHRMLMAAALSDGKSTVRNLIYSKDIQATLSCLENLGVQFETSADTVVVKGVGLPNVVTNPVFDCHESGSTLRFMIPIAMLPGSEVQFIGQGRLIERPITPFIDIFKEKSIPFTYEGMLPLHVKGKLEAGTYTMPGNISSQFITGLLYALPQLEGDSEIIMTSPLESKGYVDMTIKALSTFGIQVDNDNYQRFIVGGGQAYQAQDVRVEADYSQATFWAVAAVIGKGLTLKGLSQVTEQGDAAVLDILERMGASITWLEDGDLEIHADALEGTTIDVSEIPDALPALAVAAALAQGTTTFVGGERVRLKESDRIKAMATELAKLGVDIKETPDGLIVHGGRPLKGGDLHGWNDHRIVMALTVASICATGPISIDDAEAITKSYPHFFEDFKQLGGHVHERNLG